MAEILRINDWQTGIASSPHTGFALMRNADIETSEGAIRTQKKALTMFHTNFSTTFTADAGTEILTTAGAVEQTTGTAVTFTTTGTLPAPLVTGTTRFMITQSATSFKVALTIAAANLGTAIDITDAGTGVHTVTSVNPGTIKHQVKDPRTSTLFLIDSNGRVWYRDGSRALLLNGNSTTNASGSGLALSSFSSTSATYLFAFRNDVVDVVNVFGTANKENPSWTSSWLSLNSAAGSIDSHMALKCQDNAIYFCDGRYVGKIAEASGSTFDPSNSATYTPTSNNVLDLPPREVAEWLEEMGTLLEIAGSSYNFIYPWDRTSSSFFLPLSVPENSVKRIKNIGGTMYILAGTKGNIYSTQGTYVKKVTTIPDYVSNNAGTPAIAPVTWGGIGARNGALIFGVGATTSANSGVYLMYPDGRLVIDAIPSGGAANATSIFAESDYYFFGYASGADYFDTDRYTSFETVIQSPLFIVATKTAKAAYSKLEMQLARPASTGHARFKYRFNTNGTFSDFPSGAVSFTANGTDTSFQADIGLTDVENIQIQGELDGTVEVLEVRLIP